VFVTIAEVPVHHGTVTGRLINNCVFFVISLDL